MQCVKCNSDNVQKLSVIFQSGTHQINTRSNTVGGGAGFGGFLGGGASTRTTGQQQSHLAGIASPPKKKKYDIPFIILFLATVALVANLISGAFFILPLLAAVLLSYRAYTYNKTQWPSKYQEWSNSWHCNKCGVIYTA